MAPPPLLADLVVVLGVGVLVVGLLRRVGVSPIPGFLLAGVLLGPGGLRLVDDPRAVAGMADVGVVLLLFSVGLELSFERLRRLWRAVLVGGSLQVAATSAATAGVAVLVGLDLAAGVFIGFIVAVSSTAIVLRAFSSRGEIDAPHGRLVLGVLVFQDLAVVPMVLAVPFLAGGGSGRAIAGATARAILVLALVLVLARVLVPRILGWVARTRQRELFVLAVLGICLGTAWAVASAGVSLALGAFLAGLVVASGEYRHQALSDVIPFREVFASLFFVSVGMLLDTRALAGDLPGTFAVLGAVVAGKLVVVVVLALLLGVPTRVAVLAGAALAQVGEFSFVLLDVAKPHPLLSALVETRLTGAIVLSMVLTPLVLAASPHMAAGVARLRPLARRLGVPSPSADAAQEAHVIIAGHGVAGRALARACRRLGRAFVVVDLNAESVRRLAATGEPAVFADITSAEVLEHLGAARARELYIVINDPAAAERAVRAARAVAPRLHITVRVPYASDEAELRRAGADAVVVAENETAVESVRRLLRREGWEAAAIERELADLPGELDPR